MTRLTSGLSRTNDLSVTGRVDAVASGDRKWRSVSPSGNSSWLAFATGQRVTSHGIVLLLLLPSLSVRVAQQQNAPRAASPRTLTAQDYAEIQQLSNRYAWAIDNCTNGGYDFANLFIDEGEFSLSDQWGVSGTRAKTKGREALANVAGGDGKGSCRDPKTMLGYGISHMIVNHVITPTAEGAVGRSYLLAIGVGGDPTKIERQGGYEDVYVKTGAGWRFKSRTHVFPNMSESVQFGGRGARGR
jgi:hypothetical protein